MFVKSIMIPFHKVFHVKTEDTVRQALEVLEEQGIDGIPVVNSKQEYQGMVTRFEVYKKYYKSDLSREDFLDQTKVIEVSTRKDRFIDGEEVFENTLLELKDFPIIAVIDDENKMLGIVSRYDVMNEFQSAFGMQQKGIRIAFTSVETEGRISRLAEIIKQHHESVISLVTFDDTDKVQRRIVLKIEKRDNIDRFIQRLEKAGFRILDIKADE
ncbi:hypothetical protein Q75_08780 [Bacillus coahuilensis p1.1.43]|uniref:CBS domain-containing protein n=1 Tax=Bacillus coahuilensis p1.1.43 TaxID=1150625 RepID=A0A147K8T6_9BACI|nr:CBS domain-containing protein [Bacillus coahuilensis]KUP06603.1 hypothetical protein Q75_08780 [Bacillus coahuilensis p1.1.43]